MKYRYRDNAGGVTRKSRSRFHHLSKIGKPLLVRAYRFLSTRTYGTSKVTTLHEAILVKGTEGSARFEGLLWGYPGEGPRGLVHLLETLGLKKDQAEMLARNKREYPQQGTDWEFHVPQRCQLKQVA